MMSEILYHMFNYFGLKKEGHTVYSTVSSDLVFTLRGNCMIDVFDLETLNQIAFLDFDLSKSIMLESAFRSPLIGLPFPSSFRKRFETDLLPLKDLRSKHEVGFFVNIEYRNKGKKDVWNLDELMMAIAFETAFQSNIRHFTIKPTGDTAPYYRKKFYAKTCHLSRGGLTLTVHLETAIKRLKHIRMVEEEGLTVFFHVKGIPDQ
jgi:hypothetical protein